MIKRDYVEFTDVQKNYECRLLVPVGMQLQDAFECSVRMAQALGQAVQESKEKKESEVQEDGGEDKAVKA